MSDDDTIRAQLRAKYGVTTSRGGAGLRPLVGPDGELLCVLCERPSDASHPRSPYCVEHQTQARLEAQHRARKRKRIGDGLGVITDEVTAEELRQALAQLEEATKDLNYVIRALPSLRVTPANPVALHATRVAEAMYAARRGISALLGNKR